MLIIDNYDSFTYNIVEYFRILGINPFVIKNDELSIDEIKLKDFSRILISPGWGNPSNSGVSMSIIDYYKDKMPILGICLGMQCIAKYFGARIVRAKEPFHGKNSNIYFDKDFCLFSGLKQGFSATRYHSLIVSDYKNTNVQVKAYCDDNIPMAIQIADKNIFGVQFHPEAHLTENGIEIFRNFLDIKCKD